MSLTALYIVYFPPSVTNPGDAQKLLKKVTNHHIMPSCDGGKIYTVTYLNITLTIYRFCHACSRSPSLALEGARLPIITHTCHHHYAHQHSLDSTGLLHFVDCPSIYVCYPVCSPCQHCCCYLSPVQTLSSFIKCSLPVLASCLPASVLTVSYHFDNIAILFLH